MLKSVVRRPAVQIVFLVTMLLAIGLVLPGCNEPTIRIVRTSPDRWGVYGEHRIKGDRTLSMVIRQVGQDQAIPVPTDGGSHGLSVTDTTGTYMVKIAEIGSATTWGPFEFEVLLLHLRPLRELARWRMADNSILAASRDLKRGEIYWPGIAAITEDGNILAVTRFASGPAGENTSLRSIITLWDARTGKLLPQILKVPPPAAEARAIMAQCPDYWHYTPDALMFSSDGRYLTVLMGWDKDAKDPQTPQRPADSIYTFPIQNMEILNK